MHAGTSVREAADVSLCEAQLVVFYDGKSVQEMSWLAIYLVEYPCLLSSVRDCLSDPEIWSRTQMCPGQDHTQSVVSLQGLCHTVSGPCFTSDGPSGLPVTLDGASTNCRIFHRLLWWFFSIQAGCSPGSYSSVLNVSMQFFCHLGAAETRFVVEVVSKFLIHTSRTFGATLAFKSPGLYRLEIVGWWMYFILKHPHFPPKNQTSVITWRPMKVISVSLHCFLNEDCFLRETVSLTYFNVSSFN